MRRFVLFVLVLILGACSDAALIDIDSNGDAALTLDMEIMRTSGPSNLGEISYYFIDGTHTSGSTFHTQSDSASVTINDLKPGEWDLTVDAYDASDSLIAQGTGSITITPGGLAETTLVLYNATGLGSLDFNLIWVPELIHSESLTINLTSLNGDSVALTYDQTSGSASGLTNDLAAGFYNLNVQLFDGTTSVMGTMETVLIREGGTTSVDLDFSRINKPGQRLAVTGNEFTLQWDSDETGCDEHKIYYREHGTWNWTLLGSTGSGTVLTFTVNTALLDYGAYDFAVSSVSGTTESELHSSMDDTAVPATGWYIDWTS